MTIYDGALWQGSVWYTGVGAPDLGTGVNGDFYLRQSNSDIFYKQDGIWSVILNIKGATGSTGATGDTGATGAVGATGSPGTNGTNGLNGSTILNGTSVPSAGLGSNNDYYFRTSTGDLFQKLAGTWTLLANLLGPAGPAGAQGDPGEGFPSGGATGTYLKKVSGDDYDTEWGTLQNSEVVVALGFTPIAATTTSAVFVNNNTPSTSTTSGALKVAGGAGIVGNLNVGGGANITGNLVIGGNITVSGSSATVSSTQINVEDSIINLGGITALGADDGLDKGILFRWHNGLAPKTGFFGYDRSAGKLVFIPEATETNGVISGIIGAIDLSNSAAEVRAHMSAGTNITVNDGVINCTFTESDTLATVTARGTTTSSVMRITNTTASTNTTTGAFVVSGGVGIGGNLNVAGTISYSGSLSSLTGLDNTPIGNSLASTAVFTTCTINGGLVLNANMSGAGIIDGGTF